MRLNPTPAFVPPLIPPTDAPKKAAAAQTATSRLLIVSNRLPVTVRDREGVLEVERSPGGLATGLRGPHERSGGLWIGWSGMPSEAAAPHEPVLAEKLNELRLQGVPLSSDEVNQYYEGLSNGVLWPLFHSFVGQLPLEVEDFDIYERVNRRFADAVISAYRPGDTIWVHDYQLMLVPQMVREQLPEARVGFFLHIPFPPAELFRTFPQRERVLEGLLGADLIGFHTAAYMRNFSDAALLLLGVSTDMERLRWKGRGVQLGVFPMGIDAGAFSALGDDAEVLKEVEELRGHRGVRLLVGIDRLDYTKGIPRRLLAFERLLRDHPELREQVRLIQVAVPSRTNVDAYAEFRENTDALIGRINGAFATPHWVPIHYLFRSLSEREVASLYRAADVMLVTPIRDGMNLVAKEFVATRNDDDGVLVLSEFAGAASELGEALQVNPYDTARTAEAIYRALTMTRHERTARMRGLRRRVMQHDVRHWADRFLKKLQSPPATLEPVTMAPSSRLLIHEAQERARAAAELTLLLDYDGTLAPFASIPELAAPDEELLSLMEGLCGRPGVEVHIVSGRKGDTLEQWLGHLPLSLHAEHGFWTRPARTTEWVPAYPSQDNWQQPVIAILEDWAARTPGALVERKRSGVAWHYRMADAEYGEGQAKELMVHLTSLLSNVPVEVLVGDKVIEVRQHGVNKGRVVAPVLAQRPDALLLAMGDDRTDEDLFAALPPSAISIHVGPKPSRAGLRVADVASVRAFLKGLV